MKKAAVPILVAVILLTVVIVTEAQQPNENPTDRVSSVARSS